MRALGENFRMRGKTKENPDLSLVNTGILSRSIYVHLKLIFLIIFYVRMLIMMLTDLSIVTITRL